MNGESAGGNDGAGESSRTPSGTPVFQPADKVKMKQHRIEKEIRETREVLSEFERNLILKKEEEKSEEDDEWLSHLSDKLSHLKAELEKVYLETHVFHLRMKDNKVRVLEVNAQGDLIIYDITHSFYPTLPPDASSYQAVRFPNFAMRITGVVMMKSPVEFVAQDCSVLHEVEAVVGAQLHRHKRSILVAVSQVRKMYDLVHTAYDATNTAHESKLAGLWTMLCPDEKLEDRKSSQWGKLGFQGKDPATDFRGMGMLGLENFYQMAKSDQATLRPIIAARREYPLASVGINFTHLLYGILNADNAVKEAPGSAAWNTDLFRFLVTSISSGERQPFQKLYCDVVKLFDTAWVEANAGYMDFPTVLKRVKQIIQDALARNPRTFEELHSSLNTTIASLR